jgi:hypothetical protein
MLAAGALGAWGLVAVFGLLFVRLSWPHVEAAGNPEFGINYSCNYAEFLLLEDPANGGSPLADDRPGRERWCAATLGRLLQATGARHVRLSVEWDQVEPREGRFDFGLVDALLNEADTHGARVLLTVGMKGQRHPEYYIPAWLSSRVVLPADSEIDRDPALAAATLRMIDATVRHTAPSPAIDSWGADNEPYVPSNRATGWQLSRAFVQREVATIRAADPQHRPVTINHGQHFVFDRRWQDALTDSDVLSVSLYPFRNYDVLGWQTVVPILEIGPLAPNYAYQARNALQAGKAYWITEMQAEPWFEDDPRQHTPANPSPNLTPAKFQRTLAYARRTGASRVYLWGAEWWLFQADRFGDDSWLAAARAAIAPGGR